MSEYQVRQARDLKKSRGILSTPDNNRAKLLPESTAAKVQLFFEDDNTHARLMPGKKDFVSIKRNVHKQKRLLLCNLKELYAHFKEHNPDVSIGFSKFCSLRPKWCVTVESSGTHSVCVCTYHQNAILLVDAIKMPYLQRLNGNDSMRLQK